MQINKEILVERLVDKLDLKAAYLFKNEIRGKEQEHLLLVVRPVKGLSPNLISPIVTLCMADMEAIPFEIILEGEWLNLLRKGGFYHTYASLPDHQIYYSGKNDIPALINKKTVSSLLELAQIDYEKAKKTADEYLKASAVFESKEDLTQSLFMLHQFLAIRLKAFYALLGGTMGKSNHLEHIIKSIRKIVPHAVHIFEYDGAYKEQYRKLDLSYAHGQKDKELDISREEYVFLFERSMELKDSLDEMTTAMTKGIEEYRAALVEENKEEEARENDKVESKSKETAVKPAGGKGNKSLQVVCEDFAGFPWPEHYKEDANRLLDDIYSKHRPEQIMLVNYRTGRLFKGNPFQEVTKDEEPSEEMDMHLVILMKNRGPYHFQKVRKGILQAQLIYLDVSYVTQAMKNGDRFVNAVWKNGWLLRKKATFDTALVPVEIDWEEKAAKLDTLASNANARLKNLLMLINNSNFLTTDSAFLNLHQIMNIGIHTYLKCAVGYIPPENDLLTLFDWTTIVDLQMINFFNTFNEYEQNIIRLAMHPLKLSWSKFTVYLGPEHRKVIKIVAEKHVFFFDNLCKEVIKSMKSRMIEPTKEEITG